MNKNLNIKNKIKQKNRRRRRRGIGVIITILLSHSFNSQRMIPGRRNCMLQNPKFPKIGGNKWFLWNWMISQTKRASSCILYMDCPQIHHSIPTDTEIEIDFSRKIELSERKCVCFIFSWKMGCFIIRFKRWWRVREEDWWLTDIINN